LQFGQSTLHHVADTALAHERIGGLGRQPRDEHEAHGSPFRLLKICNIGTIGATSTGHKRSSRTCGSARCGPEPTPQAIDPARAARYSDAGYRLSKYRRLTSARRPRTPTLSKMRD